MNGITTQVDGLIQQINQTLVKPVTQLTRDLFDLNYYSFCHKVFNVASIILQYLQAKKEARSCYQKLIKKMKQAAKCRPQQQSEGQDEDGSKDQITAFLNTRKPIVQSKDRGELFKFLTVREQKQKDNKNFLENLNKIKSGILTNEKKEQKKHLSQISVQTGISWIKKLQVSGDNHHYINMLQIRQQIFGKNQIIKIHQLREPQEQIGKKQKIKTLQSKKNIQKTEKKIETNRKINQIIKKGQKSPLIQQQEKTVIRSNNGSVSKTKINVKKHKIIKQRQKKQGLGEVNDKSSKEISFDNNNYQQYMEENSKIENIQEKNYQITNKNGYQQQEIHQDSLNITINEQNMYNGSKKHISKPKSSTKQKTPNNVSKNHQITEQNSMNVQLTEKYHRQNINKSYQEHNSRFNGNIYRQGKYYSNQINHLNENDFSSINNADKIIKKDHFSQHNSYKIKDNKGTDKHQTIQQQIDANKSLKLKQNKQNSLNSRHILQKSRSNSNNNIVNQRVLKKNSNIGNLSSHTHSNGLYAQKDQNKQHLPYIKDNWDKKAPRKQRRTKEKIIDKYTTSLWQKNQATTGINGQNQISYIQDNENGQLNMNLSNIKQKMRGLLNKNRIDKKQLIQNDNYLMQTLQKIKSQSINPRNVFFGTNTKQMNGSIKIKISSKHEPKIKQCIRLMQNIHERACGRPGCRHLQRFYQFIKVFKFQGRKQLKLPTYNVGSINIQNYK